MPWPDYKTITCRSTKKTKIDNLRADPTFPVETNRIPRFSRLRCLRMHRFFDSAASVEASPNSGTDDIAFSLSPQDRHTKVVMSELNGSPAFPLTDATPATSPSPAQGFEAGATG